MAGHRHDFVAGRADGPPTPTVNPPNITQPHQDSYAILVGSARLGKRSRLMRAEQHSAETGSGVQTWRPLSSDLPSKRST